MTLTISPNSSRKFELATSSTPERTTREILTSLVSSMFRPAIVRPSTDELVTTIRAQARSVPLVESG